MPYLIYFFAINLISVLVCTLDKHYAKTHQHRISESTLFLLCFLGGSVGMYLTMKTIRHKTLHKRFMLGIPLIFLFQVAVGLFFLKNYLL